MVKQICNINKNNIRSKLDIQILRSHFSSLLNPSLPQIMYHTAMSGHYIERLDSEITIDEINAVLSKCS